MTSSPSTRQPGGDIVDAYLDSSVPDPMRHAVAPMPAEPSDAAPPVEPGSEDTTVGTVGTKQVRARLNEADTAEHLLAIQGRDRSHEVDTPKVRKAKKNATEAGKLRRWRAHADAVALRDARMRLWITIAALFAAICALGWSTASVQVTAANGAALGSAGWWLAFLVEPLISIGLMATIAVQAYAAMRGLTVDPDSEHGRTLRSTQWWLLVLTITLNTWPYVTPLWTDAPFNPIQVVVHLVGPIVAVRMIHSLPAMWAVLESLPVTPHGVTDRAGDGVTDAGHDASNPTVHTGAVTPAAPRLVTPSKPAPPRPNAPTIEQLHDQLATAVAAGSGVDPTSARSIREHLGVGMDRARTLRDTHPTAATAA